MGGVRAKRRSGRLILPSLPLAQYLTQKEEILKCVARVFESGAYILGPEVESFERAFANFCGATHGVGVNSGTDALILALRALGIGSGDEVVTVSHTALATVSAILAVGATPVLLDVDPVYYTLDPLLLDAAITERTKAVVVVHLYGQAADMDAIVAVAKSHGIYVIEDCAQAAGARYKGHRVGSIGDAGCFSFYPTKNLGAIGDAGMVVTSNSEIAERVRRLRQYGWNDSRSTDEPGLNSRLDEIQAAILTVKLSMLDASNARRMAIARRYSAAFSKLPLQLPAERPGSDHVYHLYVLSCDDRDSLRAYLAANDVVAGIHYPVPAHRHGGYESRMSIAASGLSVTNMLVEHILTLPLYPELSDEDVAYVIATVCAYYS